ncbi:ribonuclease BN (tRNA processing enzyme) [Streptomyces sp. TLI_55]|uniref:MBL fold metallo-hydrolase n=1 Tax=Streptomyces sp. TLI_55 TaxID=1938861 RepID=UPI000BC7C0B9|nr:MBL fold metallo-hydrolase [Streptomyces sp. TLI_55]SNX57546.1 ribonuclease BN (tRNA processing enzyme) [Streptomyces sp. TLI_55]
MSLTLTVLGTASPHPGPDTPCSGYLVRGGGAEVWVDAGFGSFAELRRHTDPARLDAIWISHLHADHYADLTAAVYGFAYGGITLSAPVPVYAPGECASRLAGFFGRGDTGFLSGIFDFRALRHGYAVQHGGLTMTASAVEHDVEAYGLRVEAGGRVLAYSGDTGACDALLHLAGGADLFVCEADVDAHGEGDVDPVHLTPEEAGAGARMAGGVGKLVITHVGPGLSVEDATARAASAFGGPTVAARVGETHVV